MYYNLFPIKNVPRIIKIANAMTLRFLKRFRNKHKLKFFSFMYMPHCRTFIHICITINGFYSTVFMNWFSNMSHHFALYFIETFCRFCTDWFTASFVRTVGNRIECLRNLTKTSVGYNCTSTKVAYENWSTV